MAGKKVIIRTLDIGADKQAAYFELDKEDNPALGYRAIRICLTRKEIFKTQLRVILRASAFGTVSIMFPMVISVREVRDAKEVLEECKAELKAQGMDMGEVEIGIMIETPAAVMMADELAEEVDFFSLETNHFCKATYTKGGRGNALAALTCMTTQNTLEVSGHMSFCSMKTAQLRASFAYFLALCNEHNAKGIDLQANYKTDIAYYHAFIGLLFIFGMGAFMFHHLMYKLLLQYRTACQDSDRRFLHDHR